MKLDFWSFQVQGKSPLQEDFLVVNSEKKLCVLTDGFGGSAGKIAAEKVANYLVEFVERGAGDLDATLPFEIRRYFSLAGNVLFNAVAYSNKKWNEDIGQRPWGEMGGASAIAVLVEDSRLSFASVGGCRIFLQRDGKVQKLNSPKTLAQWISPSGELEATDMEIPLMSFGTVAHLEPEIGELRLKEGDQVLVESSGVNDIIRTELLQHGVREAYWETDRNASGILVKVK